MPLVLFTWARFEVNLALIVSPLAFLCFFRTPGSVRNLFVITGAAGLTSIALASLTLGDQFSVRYLLSLALVLTSPLYFFLGSYLCSRHWDFDDALSVLAMVSAVFVTIITIQVIVTGEQVRWYVGEAGYTVLNVTLIGLPLYGSFGALSLASLLLLHLFVIGAVFATAQRRLEQVVLVAGFGAAVFLVTGSNARSAQLVLPYLLILLGLGALKGSRQVRVRAGVLLAVGLLAFSYSSSRMVEELRIVSTVTEVMGLPPTTTVSRPGHGPRAGRRRVEDMEKLSSGRKSLLEDALQEVALSPIFGTGFASYNRIDPSVGQRSRLSGNRTTHVHYLTILWKGGVLFFLPYMVLVGAFWSEALRGARARITAGVAFLFAGLVFLFVVVSLTWDILLVPSAGAYAFFLLGALGHSGRRDVADRRP